MLHHDRRELHRRAAALARTKLDECMQVNGSPRRRSSREQPSFEEDRRWELHQQLLHHLVSVVRCESGEVKRYTTLGDLQGISDSGDWLTKQCHAAGRLEEGVEVQVGAEVVAVAAFAAAFAACND